MMMTEGKALIIAEAGVNHNGSLELALDLVDAASLSGADIIKFQTFRASSVVSSGAPKADYQMDSRGCGESHLEMIRKLELGLEAHATLLERCTERGVGFLSTPFDIQSVDMLADSLRLNMLKVPSGEMTNGPLLIHVGRKGLKVVLSTGMCTLGEIEDALGALAFGFLGREEAPSLKSFRNVFASDEGQKILMKKVSLLHCTSEYPAPLEDVNLKAMETLRQAFGLPVGYSDHTEGIVVPIAAAAAGAAIIEKHFTLDRRLPGPDHSASIEPDELAEMVRSVRQVEKALGSSKKIPRPSERKNLDIARKSLVAGRSISMGEPFAEDNITCKRPGWGISPMMYWNVIGRKAPRDFSEDEVLEI